MTSIERATHGLRTLSIAAVLALVASLHATAAPLHYEIVFSGGDVATPTGAFDYDSSVPEFSNFVVVWDGLVFDMTASANAPVFNAGADLSLPLCGASAVNAALSFGILTGNGCSTTVFWNVGDLVGAVQFEFVLNTGNGNFFFTSSNQEPYDTSNCFGTCSRGNFSVAAVQIPEPATLALLILGLTGIGMLRRGASPSRHRGR